ncbi:MULTISPECIES: type III PLP-dependent enzyme domain-containing protein [unclassified Nocardia]|uniref:Y4yA family PLP-dependent enzyme n=1 Tax=unclassified Nocardia TaxID=2637762 RepID=UPI0033AC4959
MGLTDDASGGGVGGSSADAAVLRRAGLPRPGGIADRGTVPTADRPTHCAPPMPARISAVEQRLIDDPQLLGEIAEVVGGPFHVLFPERVAMNINAFHAAFRRAEVDGFVYFGKKANKAACVARACAENGAGIDVASTGELIAALAQGVRGEDLMVTGPAKSDELLWLAARHRALIAIDALDELDRLRAMELPARILLRVLPEGSASRFGLDPIELEQAVQAVAGPITLSGFSFHLSGYDATARAEQAVALVGHCLRARADGHPADTISIGGGFGVDYLDADAWARFQDSLSESWFHADPPTGGYYPYHFPVPGADMLAAVLAHHDLAGLLRDNDIRLAVEPGRALLDRAGSSVFRVQGVKTRTAHGAPYDILTVDGTSLSLSEQWFASEYLPDPVLWPAHPGDRTPTCVGATTCLESDLLSRRRIPLPRRARVGDLLVYPNTAGYQMDSNESPFHELPLPPKVVLRARGDRWRWSMDAR